MPFLENAQGDPIRSQRRIAPQAVRGVPALEARFLDFRHNGGPLAISQAEIRRAVIGQGGEPRQNLTGKRNLGGGPIDFGDLDPSNLGQLVALGNIFGAYDFVDVGDYNRWTFWLGGASEFPTYFTMLEDTDINPRARAKDGLLGGFTIGATAGGNARMTCPFVFGGYDFYGPVVQTEGGTSALPITSITRSGAVATATTASPHGLATGDVVAVTGAVETEYNVNAVITVTGASTFTYAVSGTPASPATGTIVYATNGLSITGITRSGSTATATTAVAHGLATGETVRVSGAAETEYNGDVVITVASPTTFTYTVTGSPATPATGTLLYEKLDGTLPVLANTYAGSWSADAADEDIYLHLQAYDGTDTWTVRAKIGSVAAFSSTFTVKVGNDSAGNPIFTRMVDETGEGIGPWSDQVRMHLPASGTYREGDTYRIPKRRARWVQTLDSERPISSVALAAYVAAGVGEDLEEIRFEGGVQIVTAWENLQAIPDTPGRQGATVDRTGDLVTRTTLTRRITDLRMQKAIHEGTAIPFVLDAKTDVYIPGTIRPYRFLVVQPSNRLFGELYGVAPGAQNKDEAPVFQAGQPDSAFTYDGLSFTGALAVVIENDIPLTDVTG